MDAEPGRRERKKADTRRSIADAAMQLFLARGFDAVSIREIADTADVSVATLYAHFPSKEALVFDEDDEIRQALIDAVVGRAAGVSIIDAVHGWLRDFVTESHDYESHLAEFHGLVASTPSLIEYERGMWGIIAESLATTIAEELERPADDPTIMAFTHFVMETVTLLNKGGDPGEQVEAVFALLRPGWEQFLD